MHAAIVGIEYYLPTKILTTKDLSTMFPEWAVEKIDAKTGIRHRHIAAQDEYVSDLAAAAAQKLFASGICKPEEIDFLVLCTQSPDYILPTTACLLQEKLNIPRSAGALDVNLGCSGFVYALGLIEGLIATEQASAVLLLTSDTYSKYIGPNDKASRTIFGDGAAATLIRVRSDEAASFGPFVYGTDGRGAEDLIVRNSGTHRAPAAYAKNCQNDLNADNKEFLYMDGNRVFNFAITTVPLAVHSLLNKAGIAVDDIELFIFHQANAYMLEELRRICKIPKDKFHLAIADCGNTVSSTIPIALKNAISNKHLKSGSKIMLVGFGVGYSWSATVIRWIN